MGNIFTDDVVTNAINGSPLIKQGSVVLQPKSIGSFDTQDNHVKYNEFYILENKLTNKFDEVDYYQIPLCINGGSITPTPTPTPSATPS